jgi:nucleoside-diphosphate-sugar epimerase
MTKHDKIIITGAAGLVGQNLILILIERGYTNIVALDKNLDNLAILSQLNPTVKTLCTDCAEPGAWQLEFKHAKTSIILHAQITGTDAATFERNNLIATEHTIAAIKTHKVPCSIFISSSVVHSTTQDYYTETKKQQEEMVRNSGIACCILRPTLMFGWFDPKHLGWLSRFMEKVPCFPIPGNGKYLRQPLYSRDFCHCILAAMERSMINQTHDIVGQEEINYIDLIYAIKRIKKLKTPIIKIPYRLFYCLLKVYACFSKNPPFTPDQLKALTSGDYFTGCDIKGTFGFKPTPLEQALTESYTNPTYSHITLKRSNL